MIDNNVKCDSCGKLFHKKPSKISKRNYCCMECLANDRKNIYNGENNPNKKYFFDENFFENVDTEFKAWLLGWIISDGSIRNNSITIEIHKKDIDILKIIKENFCKDIPIKKHKNRNAISYTINSKKIMEDILKIFNLDTYGKKCFKITDVSIQDDLYFSFIRGVFEGDGCARIKSAPTVTITSSSKLFLENIKNRINTPCKISQDRTTFILSFCGNNALDFLDKIYKNCNFKMLRKYNKYLEICTWTPVLKGKRNSTKIDGFYVAKTVEDAVFPSKSRASDSGYDLTLIDIWKQDGLITFYDTGIRVKPPFGYYFDLVPRSSITKTGYILANNVGIIDRTYTGSIKVPLIKIDNSKPDIELPCKIVQIIPRPIVHLQIAEVENLENTERGSGSFGSTDKI